MPTNVLPKAILVGAFIALGSSLPATATNSLTLVTKRADLRSNDTIDWVKLGTPGTYVNSPLQAKSTRNLGLTITNPTGKFITMQQGFMSWAGTFAPKDALLFAQRSGQAPITIDFDTPVRAAGTQFQSGVEGDDFTVTMEAFDSKGKSLGKVTNKGLSKFGLEGNNSAVFVGVRSSRANIDKLTLQVTGSPWRGEFPSFAMNKLDLVRNNQRSQPPVGGV